MIDINDIELATIQPALNQKLYDDIMKYYQTALKQLDNKQALDLIISSLSTNLGAVLAQVPEIYRDQYIDISKSIINNSVSYNVEELDKNKWGQVGHA